MLKPSLTLALWEVVVPVGALVAVEAGVLRLARTLPSAHLTHATLRAVDVARAWEAERVVEVSVVASAQQSVAISRPVCKISVMKACIHWHVSMQVLIFANNCGRKVNALWISDLGTVWEKMEN